MGRLEPRRVSTLKTPRQLEFGFVRHLKREENRRAREMQKAIKIARQQIYKQIKGESKYIRSRSLTRAAGFQLGLTGENKIVIYTGSTKQKVTYVPEILKPYLEPIRRTLGATFMTRVEIVKFTKT